MWGINFISIVFLVSTSLVLAQRSIMCPSDGIMYPDTRGDCSAYFICENGQMVRHYCPSGLNYHCEEKKCVKIDHCCATGGNITRAPTTVSSTTKLTSPTTELTSPTTVIPTTTSTVTTISITPAPEENVNICPSNGAKLPNVLDCHLYYVCNNEEPESRSCLENEEYSCWDQTCVPAESADCINSINQPGHSCSNDGAVMPNTKDCNSYYKCENGIVELKFCDSAKGFNAWFGKCVELSVAHCNSSTESTTSPSNQTTSSGMTTVIPASCSQDGIRIPIRGDCKSYLECAGGKLVQHKCPLGMPYNCITKSCSFSEFAPCCNNNSSNIPIFNCFPNGIKIPNPFTCNKYFECVSYKVVEQTCPDGEKYHWLSGKCGDATSGVCAPGTGDQPTTSHSDISITTDSTTGISPSPLCPQDGVKLPNTENCATYFQCVNGQPEQRICPPGLVYNCFLKICTLKIFSPCCQDDPNYSTKNGSDLNCSINGIKVPNPFTCNKYFECVSYKVVEQTCPDGEKYHWLSGKCGDATIGACAPGTDNERTTTQPDKSTSTESTPKSTSGITETVTPTPPISIQPTSSTIIPVATENVCPINGAKLPNVLDCHMYYVCNNETPQSYSCPENEEYSCWDQTCVPAESADCINSVNQPGHPCSKDGAVMPNTKDCNSYYKCENGKVELKFCDSAKGFNAWFGKCVELSVAHCNSSTESTISPPNQTTSSGMTTVIPASCEQDGTRIPIRDDCTSYLECADGQFKQHKCPNGLSYNCITSTCTVSIFTPCCNNNSSNSGSFNCLFNGIKIPNPFTCNKYFECVSHKVVEQTCPEGEKYHWFSGKCGDATSGVCAPGTGDQPTTSHSGISITTDSTTGISPSPLCPQDGVKLPDTENCTSYFQCVNGQLEQRICPPGLVYNCFFKMCTLKIFSPCCQDDPNYSTKNGSDLNCSINGIKVPNPFTCNKYFECVDYKIVEKVCTMGEKYGWIQANCVPIIGSECTPDSDDDHSTTANPLETRNPLCPSDGLKYPSYNDCSGYMECRNGHLVNIKCPPGENYNCRLENCEYQLIPHCCASKATTPGSTIISTTSANNEGTDSTPIDITDTTTTSNTENSSTTSSNSDSTATDNTAGTTASNTNEPTGTNNIETTTAVITTETTTVDNSESTGISGNQSPTTSNAGEPTASDNTDSTPIDITDTTTTSNTEKATASGINSPTTSSNSDSTATDNTAGTTASNTNEPTGTNNIETTTAVITTETTTVDNSESTGISGNQSPTTSSAGEPTASDNTDSTPIDITDTTTTSNTEKATASGINSPTTSSNSDSTATDNTAGTTASNNNESTTGVITTETTTAENSDSATTSDYQSFTSSETTTNSEINESTTTGINESTTNSPIENENICPIEGAKLPDVLDCHRYYVCDHENPVSQSCPSNQEYSCWDQTCVPAESAHCVNSLNQTDQSCSSKNMVMPNTENCSSYYECVNGKVGLQVCESGMAFNAWFGKCVNISLAHCESSTGSNSTEPPSNFCPQDGVTIPDISDCSSYFKCEGGQLVKQTCSFGFVWNCFTRTCSLKAFSPCCKDDPHSQNSSSNCLILGIKIPNPFTCDKYFECYKFNIVEKQCSPGMKYDWIKMICVDAKSGHCAPTIGGDNSSSTASPETTTLSNSCSMNTKLPDINDCNSYYECVDGHEIHKTCPFNTVYNCWLKICSISIGVHHCCKNNNNENGSSYACTSLGGKTPDPYNCHNYYQCSFFKTVLKSCGNGENFDSQTLSCKAEKEATCIENVGEGGPVTTETSTEITTAVSPSAMCPQKGVTIPDHSDCKGYFQCDGNGQLVKKTCPTGLVWNCFTKSCTLQIFSPCCKDDPYNNKTSNSDFCLISGIKIPNFLNCNKYYECVKNTITEKSCATGEKYDWLQGKCLTATTGSCAPGSNGSTILPGGDSSSTVTTTIQIPISSSTTTAIPTSSSTTTSGPIISTTTTANPTTKGRSPMCPNDGIKYPSTTPNDCTGYFECVNGQMVKKHCLVGVNYNCRLEACDPTTSHCCAAGAH